MFFILFHPSLEFLEHGPRDTISRAELVEVDRLTPNIDLVVRPGSLAGETKVHFGVLTFQDFHVTNSASLACFQILFPPRVSVELEGNVLVEATSQTPKYCSF